MCDLASHRDAGQQEIHHGDPSVPGLLLAWGPAGDAWGSFASRWAVWFGDWQRSTFTLFCSSVGCFSTLAEICEEIEFWIN